MTQRLVLVSLFAVASSLANQTSYAPLVTTPALTKGPELAAGFNAHNSRNNIGVTGGAIYWHPKVDGTFFTYTVASSQAAIPLQGTIDEIPFKWSFGLDVGLFINTKYDKWKINADYTYFQKNTTRKVNAQGPNNALVPLKGYSGLASDTAFIYSCTQATSEFNLSYQTGVLNINKSYFATKALSFTPAIGLEGAAIYLKQISKYSGGVSDPDDDTVFGLGANFTRIRDKTSLAGLGPFMGLSSQWFFYHRFNLFANANFSYLFSRYKLAHTERYSGDSTRTIDLTTGLHRLTPNASLSFGVGYDTYLNQKQNRNHFNLSLAYDAVYWWQVYRPIVVSSVTNVVPTLPGNLAFYGLSLIASVEF